MRTKRMIQLTAFAMIGALLFQQIPVNAAQTESTEPITAETTAETTAIKTEYAATEVEEAYILSEIPDLREEAVKYFRRSDGTMLAATYPQPVHYYQDGTYHEIDNSLYLVTENGKEYWKNTANAVQMFLPEQFGAAPVMIRHDGYTVEVSLGTADASTAQVSQPQVQTDDTAALQARLRNEAGSSDMEDIRRQNDDSFLKKHTLASSVTYKKAANNFDIAYDLRGTTLKETLILKNPPQQTSYTFTIRCEGLIATLRSDNTVYFTVPGETSPRFIVPAPYMWDSLNVYSSDITVTLTEEDNHTYRYTLTPDGEWLASSQRQYPVMLDPSLQTGDICTVKDTTGIPDSTAPSWLTATGEQTYLKVGRRSSKEVSALIYSPLPAELTQNTNQLIQASLNLRVRSRNYLSASGLQVNARRITSDWGTGNIAENNPKYGSSFPSRDSTILDYTIVTADSSAAVSFDITKAVREWLDGVSANYGIMLSGYITQTSENFFTFYDSDYSTGTSDDATDPQFCYIYRSVSGLEDYWSYSSASVGNAGSVSVNHFNGNLTLVQPLTLDCGGDRMPVSISMIYNSNKSGAEPSDRYSRCGYGWQTNYHLHIRESSFSTDSEELLKYKYYLNDADGTHHYFYFENNSSTGKDEDGLGYTLSVDSSVSTDDRTGSRYIITDKQKNTMHFNGLGNLIRIQDTNNNAIVLSYDTITVYGISRDRIQTITDGAGRVYTFIYRSETSSPEHIYGIRDPYGRVTSLEYSTGRLLYVQSPDNQRVYFRIAQADGRLVETVENRDGTKTTLSWSGERCTAIKTVNPSANNAVTEQLKFSYDQFETTVTDRNGENIVYQTNQYGQPTGVLHRGTGAATFSSYTAGNSTSNTANKLLSQSKVQKGVYNLLKNHRFDSSIAEFSPIFAATQTVTGSFDSTKGHIGKGSIKVTRTSAGTSDNPYAYYVQNYTADRDGYYTFSAYVNTGGVSFSDMGATIRIEKWSADGKNLGGEYISVDHTESDEWKRISVTNDYSAGDTVRCLVGFADKTSLGTVWFDDLQLEVGEVANPYNLVENSAVQEGMDQWAYAGSAQHVTLAEGEVPDLEQALSITCPVGVGKCRYGQIIRADGKKGDVFSLSGWQKADAAPDGDFSLMIEFYDTNGRFSGEYKEQFNPYISEWQFRSYKIIAPCDYSQICVYYNYTNNVNTLMGTGMCLQKENYGQTYTYDSNGNVVSSVDLAQSESQFAYSRDMLAKMIDPVGSQYMYGYHYSTRNLQSAISNQGIDYTFTYDSAGNATQAVTASRPLAQQLEANKEYIIINAHSGHALDSGWRGNLQDLATTYYYDSKATYQHWKLIPISGTSDVYMMQAMGFPTSSLMLEVCNGSGNDGTGVCINTRNDATPQRFKIVKEGTTYRIYTGASSYARCIDGQMGSTEISPSRAVQQKNVNTSTVKKGQLWYFFEVDPADSRTMTTSATYSEDKNFLNTFTDAAGNTLTYGYTDKGQLQTVTDATGKTTTYTYKDNTNTLATVKREDTTVSYTYDSADRLSQIGVNENGRYVFGYNEYGLASTIQVGRVTDGELSTRALSSSTYNNRLLMQNMTYGNGQVVTYAYDALDRVSERRFSSDSGAFLYRYTADGQLGLVRDQPNNRQTRYVYDLSGRLVTTRANVRADRDGGALIGELTYHYEDETNRLSSWVLTLPFTEQTTGFVYGNGEAYQFSEAVYGVKRNGTQELTYSYDALGRRASRKLTVSGREQTYTYYDAGTEDKTTGLIEEITDGGVIMKYTYDSLGNIQTVSRNGTRKESYRYDGLNQLVEANIEGTVYTYTYDDNGNLKTAYNGVRTNVYGYTDSTWTDLLTEYNGQTLTYDTIGNPLNYRDGMTMTWQRGRQLASITTTGGTSAYTYDESGMRLSKTVNGGTTAYYVLDGTLYGQQNADGKRLLFMYDEQGMAYGFTYDGTAYYYVLNMQGDVTGILDGSGTQVVSYTYDPWGKPLTTTGSLADTIGAYNPLRYRGYYYDAETGFYYVSSRYYDPEIGRWINADVTDVLTAAPMGVTHKNLFAYCDNNPVARVDCGGYFWDTVFDVISLGVSIVEVCVNPTDPWAWAGLAGDAIDLIPFVTGVGEVTRAAKTIDKVANTVQIAKAVDFTEDAADLVKTLDRSSGFTKSTASAGRKIHDGYKVGDRFNPDWKEYKDIKGIRPDYVDFDNKIIYELKPMNPWSVRRGIRQLKKYNKALGGGYTMRLELY